MVPAADRDSAEPALRCVKLETYGDGLAVAGADTPRVAARVMDWDAARPGTEHAALLLANIFHDVARGVGPWPVTIGLGDGIVSFEAAGRTTTARLVDARFPAYRRFFDMEFASWARVDTAALLEAVRRVALFAQKEAPAVRLDFVQGAVTVRSGGDVGRGSQTVAAQLDGPEVELDFLAGFLIDALTAIAADHETVRIGMDGPRRPALFEGDTETPACRCAVMALRAS